MSYRQNYLDRANWQDTISELSSVARQQGGKLSGPESAFLLSSAGYPSKSNRLFTGEYGQNISRVRGMNLQPELQYLVQQALIRNAPRIEDFSNQQYPSRYGVGPYNQVSPSRYSPNQQYSSRGPYNQVSPSRYSPNFNNQRELNLLNTRPLPNQWRYSPVYNRNFVLYEK